MGELLSIYAVLCLTAASFGAAHSEGFMPFQANEALWKAIGFSGLAVFQARWVVQWLHAEKHREAKVPPIFWWLSLAGAVIETCYFLRQRDLVGIAGYCVSFVPYTRNLYFIYSKKKPTAAEGTETVAATN